IAANGRDVAFEATVDGAAEAGIYVMRGGGGSIEAIARPGDVPPGGGVILSTVRACVNSRGDVLYGAVVQFESGRLSSSLFLAEKSGQFTRRAAGLGDLMPDGFRFENAVRSQGSWSLNDRGDVAFVARTASDPIPFFGGFLIFESTGVYVSSS